MNSKKHWNSNRMMIFISNFEFIWFRYWTINFQTIDVTLHKIFQSCFDRVETFTYENFNRNSFETLSDDFLFVSLFMNKIDIQRKKSWNYDFQSYFNRIRTFTCQNSRQNSFETFFEDSLFIFLSWRKLTFKIKKIILLLDVFWHRRRNLCLKKRNSVTISIWQHIVTIQ